MSAPALSPSVEIVDHHPVTSSQKVAEYFGKNHRDVLRSIQNLPCSPEFTERNFAPSEYTDSTGRKLPEYLLTKNGFMFLVMGFTGAKAAKLKEAYIAEFDRMEAELLRLELSGKSPSQKPLAHEEDLELRRATPIQRLILVALAHHVGPDGFCEVSQQTLASETGLSRRAVNRNLKGLEWLGLIESRQIPGEHLKRYGFKSGRSPFSRPGTSGGPVPALKSGRPGIDPSTLDTPIPEGLLERRQSYETLLLMRTFTRSPIDRLLLRLEEAGVDVSGARYELSLGRELLSIYSTILDNVQGQSSIPREAAKAGLSLPKKGGLK